MKIRALPIAVSVVGVLLVGLLLYGVANSSPSRTLDESLARGEHPLAPEANRALPRLAAPRDDLARRRCAATSCC